MNEQSDTTRGRMSNFTLRKLDGSVRDFMLLSLRSKSPLFHYPTDGQCETTEAFIIAVNALVAVHAAGIAKARPRQSLESAITPKKTITKHVEVLFFGRWLLIDGKPGYRPVRGQAADEVVVFRTVAAIVAEILDRQRRVENAKSPIMQAAVDKNRSRGANSPITRTDLRNRWEAMYGERPDASAFKARINTARRYMRNYLDVVQRPEGAFGRSGPLKSENIAKALRMMASK